MSTMSIPNHEEQSNEESPRIKRRKIDVNTSTSTQNRRKPFTTEQLRWRTPAEQHSYSTKLIDALRQVRRRATAPPPPSSPPLSGSRAVRDAADNALAIAAKGRTHWSRAILSNRRKLRLRNHKKSKIRSKFQPPPPLTAVKTGLSGQPGKTPPLEKRVKVLGRLVPGCRKLSFPNLLEETTDYIAALQMQVRAMAALAELLSGSVPISGSTGGEPANNVSNDRLDSDRDNPVH